MRRWIAFILLAGIVLAVGTPTNTSAGQTLYGDASCDGHVNSIDAAVILQYSAGLLHQLGCSGNADVNGDGHTNSLDSALILQYAAGLLTHLGPSATPPRPTASDTTPTTTAEPLPSPGLYWVDCRVFCRLVLAPDVTCVQTPPAHAVSTVVCSSASGGWEMNCSTSGVPTPPRLDCLNSRDGAFYCVPSADRTSGGCQGDAWFGSCNAEAPDPSSTQLHCWRTDGTETSTVDCQITYGADQTEPTATYSCESQGTAFSCELQDATGMLGCAPSSPAGGRFQVGHSRLQSFELIASEKQ